MDMNDVIIKEYVTIPVYFYKLLGDHVEIYFGKLYILFDPDRRNIVDAYFKNDEVKLPCHSEPGKIFADGVWFEKPSLEKAIDIFVDRMNKESQELDLKRRVLYGDIAGLVLQKMEAEKNG